MEKFLTLGEAAEYLSVSEDTIKRYVEKGELPTYKLDRALRLKVDDIDNLVSRSFEVLLTRGLRARVHHVVETPGGGDVWRVIIKFYDTTKENRPVSEFGQNKTFTEYYVYVTAEYLEGPAKLPANEMGAEKFALRFIKDRFEQTADENGDRDITRITENKATCSNGRCNRGEEGL